MTNIIAIAGLAFTVVVTIIGATWYLGDIIGGVKASVDIIRTNDLEHIYARLGNIETRLMEG